MYTLNKKIINLVPYEPISGTYDIRLDANECPDNLPEFIREEIKAEIDKLAFNRYPDPMASSVVEAFASYYGINPALVTAGNGSDELIFLIEAAFLEKGDKMLVVSPDFSMYNFYSSICEVECETFVKNDDLDIDVDALIEKVNSDGIKLLMFSNPCNPTGRGITADEARRLVTSVDALVILDEAYMDFWDQSLLSEVEKYSNLIIFRTASKAVGSAALRLGFAVANETISRAVKAVKSPYNVNSFSQAAGAVIFKNKEYLQNRQKTIVKNRETLYNGLMELGNALEDFTPIESVANFVFVRTSQAEKIFAYLKSKSIVVRLMGSYLRITAGTGQEVEQVFNSIKEYFEVTA
nr:histidinol-phosphate transaminase [uncultured Ruminococcus sp.]